MQAVVNVDGEKIRLDIRGCCQASCILTLAEARELSQALADATWEVIGGENPEEC